MAVDIMRIPIFCALDNPDELVWKKGLEMFQCVTPVAADVECDEAAVAHATAERNGVSDH